LRLSQKKRKRKMETIRNKFFTDMGIRLGRSMHHIFNRRNSLIIITILIVPVALTLLLVYVFGGAIQILEEIFFTLIAKREEN